MNKNDIIISYVYQNLITIILKQEEWWLIFNKSYKIKDSKYSESFFYVSILQYISISIY